MSEWTPSRIEREIEATTAEIKATLANGPYFDPLAVDDEGKPDRCQTLKRVQVLITKRMGLRICLGMRRAPKLFPPAIAMKRQGLNASDLLAA